MCGIVGYTGSRSCRGLLLEGLRHLEYRGYDSAGLSLVGRAGVESVHAVGKLSFLEEAVAARDERDEGTANFPVPATAGIAHTRWATHGRVTQENAHPHSDPSGRVQIVMNGIVENWRELRRRLEARGLGVHLRDRHRGGRAPDRLLPRRRPARGRAPRLLRAARATTPSSRSAPTSPTCSWARARRPRWWSAGATARTSSAPPCPPSWTETRRVQFLEDDEIVAMTPDEVRIYNLDGEEVEREIEEVDWDQAAAEKGGFETFMLKEIHEQPEAIAETVGDRLRPDGTLDLTDLGISDDELRSFRRVLVVACGTSYHAGVVARYAIEEWSGVPVGVDIASEFRYRKPLFDEQRPRGGHHPVGRDRRHPGRDAPGPRQRGAGDRDHQRHGKPGHARLRRRPVHPRGARDRRGGHEDLRGPDRRDVPAGPQARRGARHPAGRRDGRIGLRPAGDAAPHRAHPRSTQTEHIAEIGERFRDAGFFFYLGRHIGLPIALEGALKMKEISYVPSDAYAAGEMKHGPIALLDDRTPVVCVATELPMLDKMLSNMAEVQARGAHVIAVATEGSTEAAENSEEVLYVPKTDWLLQPLLAVVPLQLLSYFVARARGLNIDQPRNLAKTVTVE